jgi:hypothetical protein
LGQRLRRASATSARATPGWRISSHAVPSPAAIPAIATLRHRRSRLAVRSRTSRRARRTRATAARTPPDARGSGRTARLTGPPSCTIQRRMPSHHRRESDTRHQTHPADLQIHGHPEPWRRDSLTSMHRWSLSTARMSPVARSTAMTSRCAAHFSTVCRRTVIVGGVVQRAFLGGCAPRLSAVGFAHPAHPPHAAERDWNLPPARFSPRFGHSP